MAPVKLFYETYCCCQILYEIDDALIAKLSATELRLNVCQLSQKNTRQISAYLCVTSFHASQDWEIIDDTCIIAP